MKVLSVHSKALPGTVSHGTHQPDVLIAKFTSLLNKHAEVEYTNHEKRIIALASDYYYSNRLNNMMDRYPDIAESVSCFLNDELWYAMDSIAPDDCMFTSHDGDGSDFGFWQHCFDCGFQHCNGECSEEDYYETDTDDYEAIKYAEKESDLF